MQNITLINEHFEYVIAQFNFNRRRYHYLPCDLITYFFTFVVTNI
ncbi:MAG: hypothetical protein ACI9YH_003892 [Colwellia sp.]|jgi:hypothetical protein